MYVWTVSFILLSNLLPIDLISFFSTMVSHPRLRGSFPSLLGLQFIIAKTIIKSTKKKKNI